MKVSVIIPVYNSEKYLKQTLNSICFQTYKDLEIVCVLDCPTDNSTEIVKRLAKEDNRIKPVELTQNVGHANARNIGVLNTSGEYIQFMDSDDLISPNFYESMVDAATAADADVAACSVFYEQKPKQSIWFRKSEVLFDHNKIKKTEVTIQGWSWRYLIRKSFWNSHNLSFPNLVMMVDIPVMIPMIYYADKVAICPNAVYYYKNRENSVLNKKNCNQELEKIRKNDMITAHKLFQDFIRTHNIDRPGKLRRHYMSFRTKRTICMNDPIEYGTMDEKISVIVPVYNAEKYLKQTLDSIRFQTYTNLEIICVLDCPTDNSDAIVENIAKEDNRVKPVRHQKNMGLPAARNTGVQNAAGKYIHFIDSDDLISPDFYEIMVSAAVKNDADVAACSVFYEKKPWRSIWFRRSEVLSGPSKIQKTEVAIMGWSWRYLIRKDFWNGNNLSFPNLVPMEDMPAMIPMIHYANRVVLCPSAVYFYKHRESSILNNDYDREREKSRSKNRKKARKTFRDFMRVNKIKRPSRLLYYIKKRFA